MTIKMPFSVKPPQFSTGKFLMDEYISEIEGNVGYADTRVFIHEVADDPFDDSQNVIFECNKRNIHTIEVITLNKYPMSSRSKGTCKQDYLKYSSFNVSFHSFSGALCSQLLIQESIIRHCGCILSSLPTNNDTFRTMQLCIESHESYDCANNVTEKEQEKVASECLPNCFRKMLNIRSELTSLQKSYSNKTIRQKVSMADLCILDSGNASTNICCEIINSILQEQFPTISNITCPPNNFSQSTEEKYIINKYPYDPPGGKRYDKNFISNECHMINLKVQLWPNKLKNEETLIVGVSTLLSRLAGMCSFLTGFTFTFIGEVIEVVCIWISERRSVGVVHS